MIGDFLLYFMNSNESLLFSGQKGALITASMTVKQDR